MRRASFRGLLACLGLLAGLAALLTAAGCDPKAPLEVPGTERPANFPPLVFALDVNPPDAAAFTLGRRLFYERRLSVDNSTSCGSCHQPLLAFAHSGHPFSTGVGGHMGHRNAPALQNLRWRQTLMADGGVLHLSAQPLAPLSDSSEMHLPITAALARLNADASYREQFAAVYGPGPITVEQFMRALAQFTAALTSSNSRYDHHVRHEDGGTFSVQELRGQVLFAAKCSSCHATDLFTDESFRNNGLDRTFPRDSGRARISLKHGDVGRFKVPSLRNVARTAPYMHDGRFATLPQVLAHYAHGVVPSPTLDPLLRQPNGQLGIPLTTQEQADLLAFLATLTDEQFLADKRLAEPKP